MGFPVHIITKSDLVLRDLDTAANDQAQSTPPCRFTITTADDDLARKLEPGAPPRLSAACAPCRRWRRTASTPA